MTRRTEIVDEDGNELPTPAPDSPVMQIIYLIEYGRKRGFQIGPNVQVGDTIVQVKDLRQADAYARAHHESSPELLEGSDMATLLTPDG